MMTAEQSEAGRAALFTGYVEPSFCVPSSTLTKPLPQMAETKQLLKTMERKKIKALLRNSHWPAEHEVRQELWWSICNAVKTIRGSIYQDMMHDVFGPEGNYNASLPAFVDPGNMYHYHLSTSGIITAKKIVCILGKARPDVAFGPAIFALSSLLLHYVDEEDCFNCMEVLLDSKLNYIIQTKVAYEASRHVLKQLARKYAKGCYQYIVKAEIPIEKVLDNWLWWILRDLPFSYLVRVVDCYLYEGPKILYRVALAILILFHKVKVKGGPEKVDLDLGSAISQFCEDMPGLSVDRLLKTAFGIRGLSRKEIGKLILKNEMYVKSLSQNVHKTLTIPKSPSCETLNSRVKVSRTFSLQEVGGTTLTADQWDMIWQWIPPRVTVMVPEKIFSTSEHGVSLKTFFNKVEGWQPTLMVIKAVTGEIFGAFCSVDWSLRHENERNLTYIGTGETFIFSIQPDTIKYEWVGIKLQEDTPNSAHLFMSGDNSQVNIGGGNGTAIHLDETLDACRTERCDTFDNPAFVIDKDFTCAVLEVFGFE